MTTQPDQDRRGEFRPLTAPQLGPEPAAPAEPINWFTRLAPKLPEGKDANSLPTRPPASHSGPARPALFLDVDNIANSERERQMIGEPEPPEIVKLRYEAEQTARELVGEAYVQAAKIEEEARAQGRQEGYRAGYATGERDARMALTAQADLERIAYREDLAALIAHIEAERQRVWNDIEPQVISLVFDLVKHVIKQEIEANPDVVMSVIRNALRRVADGSSLRIRVHANDLETVRGHREEILSLLDNVRNVEIIEDRRVGAGGCVVETPAGNIDARIETQLNEVGNTLNQMKERQ
jgi:flagellar assembly protein FliH